MGQKSSQQLEDGRKPVRSTLEYYMSEENWSRDLYLQRLSHENGGAVPIAEIILFKKVRSMLDKTLGTATTTEQRVDYVCSCLTPTHLCTIEVVLSPPTIPRHALRRKALCTIVRDYIEHLFAPDNFAKDRYLQELVMSSEGGWVNLSEIRSWPRCRTMVLGLTPVAELALTLLHPIASNVVEVHADRQRVRRILPSSSAVAAMPDDHVGFSELLPLANVPKKAASSGISILQYNILAQMLAESDHLPYANPSILRWSYRLPRILACLQASGADLITLQEVQGMMRSATHPDKDDHRAFLHHAMRKVGYNSFYRRKETGKAVDIGNMIFFRVDAFEIEDRILLKYEEAIPTCLSITSGELWNRYCSGKQLAIIMRLLHKPTGRRIVVCTTHITVNWENPDTQLAQVFALTQRLQRPDFAGLPTIITGDFNIKPENPIYDFLSKASLTSDPMLNAVPEIGCVFPASGINHTLQLRSAYAAFTGAEPGTTNVKGIERGSTATRFTGCLDYIWFSPHLRVTGVRPVPSLSESQRENGGLPNSFQPSDHLPIGASFAFADTGGGWKK